MTQEGSLAPGLARVGNWQPLLSNPHSRTTIGPTIDHGGAFAIPHQMRDLLDIPAERHARDLCIQSMTPLPTPLYRCRLKRRPGVGVPGGFACRSCGSHGG